MSIEAVKQLVRNAKRFELPADDAQPNEAVGQNEERDHEAPVQASSSSDFYAHLPSHSYLFVPTRELWPAASVDGTLPWPRIKVKDPETEAVKEKTIRPSSWLDKHRPVQQLTWNPGEPQVIKNRVMQVSGWVTHTGATVFNLYRAPVRPHGKANAARLWLDHVRRVYPDDAEHIINWLAHRVQRPGDKCNHAIVLGGVQGIGKDTILEPVKAAVGPWNWSDVSPQQMLGRFNGWVKAVVVRINEARDLGDVDRFAFYDATKSVIAAPPDVIRVDEKHLRETYVANVCGVIITTNHASDGLYLPADDRRHYVCWSPRSRADFEEGYWRTLYKWFADGGVGHVCSYLASLDLSGFDPKAPPPKTAAFWQVVASGEAPESGEMRDLLELMSSPRAVTLAELIERAGQHHRHDLADELKERKNRRTLPHRLERVGYVPVRNPDAEDGLWKVSGKRQAVYSQRSLVLADQIRAARTKT